MGNHIAVAENGKYIIGKKLFVTEKGVHRKGKKAFLTKDGKHRLVFSAGNDWAKYSCDVIAAHYKETENTGATVESDWVSSKMFLYDYYSFTTEDGYTGTTGAYYSGGAGVGYYKVSKKQVVRIDSITVNDSYLHYTGTVVGACEFMETAYTKGTSDYGKLFADEGELPEAGTLIEGSVAEGYCVLQISGAYYYYEIV